MAKNKSADTVNETKNSQIKIILLSDFDDRSNLYCNSFIKVGEREVVIAGRKKGDILSFPVSVGNYEIIVGNDISSKVKSLKISVKPNQDISIGIKSTFLSYDFFCC